MKSVFLKNIALAGLCAALGLSACSTKGDLEALRTDVDRRGEARLQQAQAPIQTQQAELWAELEAIKSRLNAIQGQLDGVARSESSQKGPSQADMARQLEAVRTAVQQLGGDVPPPLLGAAQAGQAPAPFAPQAAPGQPGQAQAVMPVANMDASQARAALSADPAKGQSVVIPMPGQAAPAQGAPAAGAAVAPAAAANVSQTLYQKAMEAFRNRKYDDAERMFGEFAATFKKDPLVPDAMAWRGDSLFQMGKYAEAVLIYDEIRSKFPKSNKVQPAMLKEGICLYKLGKKEAGKHLLKDLIRRYPNSPQAKAASNYIDTNG